MGRRDERGAALVFVALTMSLLIVVGAFAVDLGMQRVLRRDMQALADAVALDLARELDGRTKGELEPVVEAAKVASVARNARGLDDSPDVRVDLGVATEAGFTTILDDAVPNAVRAVAEGDVGFAFARGDGGAVRSAVATSEPEACFRVGSYAANLASGDSWLLKPLLGLLGGSVTLSVLDLQGLAAADVRLLDLFGQPGLGLDVDALTFDQLLATKVSLNQLLAAAVNVLARESDQTARLAVEAFGQKIAALPLPAVQFSLGQLLDLATASRAALETGVNVLDIVAGSLFVANGDRVIDLGLDVRYDTEELFDGFGSFLDALGVFGATVDLPVGVEVGQRPIKHCGRPGIVGESAQVVLHIGDGTPGKHELDITLLGNDLELDLDLELAVTPVRAELDDVSCTTTGGRTVHMSVDHGLADLDGQVGITLKGWFGVPLADGRIGLDIAVATQDEPVEIDWPAEATTDQSTTVGRGDGLPLGSISLSTERLAVLGIDLSTITTPIAKVVSSTLNWVLDSVNTALLKPLFATLGLDVAGGRIHVEPTPDCGVPRLRG